MLLLKTAIIPAAWLRTFWFRWSPKRSLLLFGTWTTWYTTIGHLGQLVPRQLPPFVCWKKVGTYKLWARCPRTRCQGASSYWRSGEKTLNLDYRTRWQPVSFQTWRPLSPLSPTSDPRWWLDRVGIHCLVCPLLSLTSIAVLPLELSLLYHWSSEEEVSTLC